MPFRPRRLLTKLTTLVAVGVLALLVASWTVPQSGTAAAVAGGGTYRLADPSFYLTGGFDPTSEYAYQPWELYYIMIRTLVSYPHVAGVAGAQILPDLAAGMPRITQGGRVYTFTLKSGVRFGPPVNREVTSKDVAYAFERMASAPEGAQYSFYYSIIKGFVAHPGPPRPISGIQTPNARTIVFHLTQPAGDFLARLTLPATAPIPAEVAKCFPKAGDYGRYVISSGPYMLKGSEKLNISSCSAMKPIAGADPSQQFELVRNPNYDPKTDNPKIRENHIDGLVWTIDPNVQDIFNRIQAGDLDGTTVPPPSKVIQQYARDSSLRSRLKVNPANRTWPLAMNMTQPPFDDVHVRKAVNWLLNKTLLQTAAGGSLAHPQATHDLPDILVKNQLSSYAPFGSGGSLEKAKAEMKLSRYDPQRKGMCDAPACKNVVIAIPNYPPATTMQAVLQQQFAQIGIDVTIRQFSNPYATFGNVSKNIAANFGIPLSADYPDAFGFYSALQGAGIIAQGNFNWSLIGLTSAQAKSLGIKGSTHNVPSLDGPINKCERLSGAVRLGCFANVDRVMSGQIVPWVPVFKDVTVTVVGADVSEFQFDQAQGYQAFAHVALKKP